MKMNFFGLRSISSAKTLAAACALLLPAVTHAGVAFFDPTAGAPTKLSDVHIYTSISTKVIDTALKYYDVNAALWSDNAHKDRWIILPPGKHVVYNDTTDKFAYPDSTIFVKLFRHDVTPGDSSTRLYWETRLLVKKAGNNNNWYGFSYKWNATATEAYLVDVNNGLDTVLFLNGAPHYRKWHYPSQTECNTCHRVSDVGRSVLGFYPAQLKHPTSTGNQVTDLFTKGVFTGTQPSATDLARRFRGMSEPIPSGLSPTERFKTIDTMARSYIAANCSGCHGNKGLDDDAASHAATLNYDFYNLKPMMEFGYRYTSPFRLDESDADLQVGDTTVRPQGNWQFRTTLQEWGISTAAGGNFDMTKPTAAAFPTGVYPSPYLVVPKYAAYSTVLFRQTARRTPGMDSSDVFQSLGISDPGQWKRWLFKAKWGSKAWRDSLTAHSVTLDKIFTADLFIHDERQMPPLATYIPDTSALKVLGEWVKNYYSVQVVPGENPVASIHGMHFALQQGMPVIQNGIVIVPEGWTGKAVMTGLNGRTTPLATVGRGRYAIPASLPAGVYFIRIGDRSFKTSVMK